ncbi:hypothetical protein, partial [Lapidilactobacillus concavus]|uniref:hypothetical protein n=1 Tax=Lapidilactobacillus concavus TaxID=287844 RepID=UPI001F3A46EE
QQKLKKSILSICHSRHTNNTKIHAKILAHFKRNKQVFGVNLNIYRISISLFDAITIFKT